MIPLLLPLALAAKPDSDACHAVRSVLSATTFTLATPYRYEWSADAVDVTSGTLLVLGVDPTWLVPSNTRQPTLFAGALPVERLGTGYPDGHLVVVVPSVVDLARAPLYFSGYDLPERIDSAAGKRALDAASTAGCAPLPIPAQKALSLPGRTALLDHAARLDLATP